MPSATLSLGSSGYDLLETLDDGSTVGASKREQLSVTRAGTSFNIRSLNGGDKTIENLGINSEGAPSVISRQTNQPIGNDIQSTTNIFAGLKDFKASLGSGGDSLNIFGNVSGSKIELDDSDNQQSFGNDLLSINGSVTGGEEDDTSVNRIFTGSGNDTIRIAGSLSDAFVHLGVGNDSLSVSQDVVRADIKGDDGNDFLEFRGEAGSTFNGGVRVNAGSGSDTVVFRKTVFGSEADKNSYFGDYGNNSVQDPGTTAVELGDGNDSLILGNGAVNVEVNTGAGKDTINLSGSFINTTLHLDGTGGSSYGSDAGSDRITSSSQATFIDTNFNSNNHSGDTLVFGSANTFINSGIFLGNPSTDYNANSGGDSLVFSSSTQFINTAISTGLGADTIVFGANSAFYGLNINLGGNDNAADVIRMSSNTDITGFSIQGADSYDTLFIGTTAYTYNGTDFTNTNGSSWRSYTV